MLVNICDISEWYMILVIYLWFFYKLIMIFVCIKGIGFKIKIYFWF